MILRYIPLLLLPVVPLLARYVDSSLESSRTRDEALYFESGETLRRLCPGFEGLLADIYWLRAVQHFGAEHLLGDEARYPLLEPLIRITTDLDKRFEFAYRYGAIFLAENKPEGAGRPEAALALLDRGIANNPSAWRLWMDKGLLFLTFFKQPKQASEALLEGSKIPGAAEWMKTLAAEVLIIGGERRAARQLWARVFEETEGAFKESARFHLLILEARDLADQWTAKVAEDVSKTGRRPSSLFELRQKEGLRLPLEDSSGTPFEYDVNSGQVTISTKSPLWRPI